MEIPVIGTKFHTEIISHQHALLEATAIVGMSANAVEAHDLNFITVPQASVRWPSFFCSQVGFVSVLAYLIQNNLPFELEVAPHGPALGRYKLYPAIDEHTGTILRSIDPRRASELQEMQVHVQQFFDKLKTAEPLEGSDESDDNF